MKCYCSWILMVSLFFHYDIHAQDSTGKLNIKRCIDIAIQNNLQIKQSEIQMQNNGVLYKQAKDNLLPSLNATLIQGNNYGRSISNVNNTYVDEQNGSGTYGLNANLLLFNGLQLQNAIKANAYAYDASRMDWQQQKDNITLSVLLAYLTVLNSRDQLDIARSQAEVDARQVERLEIENQAGSITPSTLYDLKGQYASDEVNVVNAVNTFESAKISLFTLLNIPYQKDATYEMVDMNADINVFGSSADSIYQIALQTIPNIKATDLRVMSYQKGIAVAKGKLYPSLYLYGSLNSNYSSIATSSIPGSQYNIVTGDFVTYGGNNYYVNTTGYESQKISFGDQFKNNRFQQFGLQLNIPILNYFSARNNVKFAKLNYQNAMVLANTSKNQLQQLVEQAYQNLLSAYGQYKGFADQMKAYGESFRIAEIRFNAGAITSVDYVIAKNNFDRANTSLNTAKYNYIFRTKILEYYQGRLSF
jgi:outer membrane protein